jgi:hypothetical protein
MLLINSFLLPDFIHVEDSFWDSMTAPMAEPRKRRKNWINAPASGPIAESINRFNSFLKEAADESYPELFAPLTEGQGKPTAPRLKPDADKVLGPVRTFQCVVCFDDFPLPSAISCHSEGEFIDLVEPSNSQRPESHSFCPDCIRGQAGAATTDTPISTGGIGLRCMAEGCKNAILFGKWWWTFLAGCGELIAMVLADCRSFIPPKVRKVLNDRIVEEVLGMAGFTDLER